jgi:hypothetical protein
MRCNNKQPSKLELAVSGQETGMLAPLSRRSAIRNAVLAKLSLEDLAAMGPFLQTIGLKERMVLQKLKKPIDRVYFTRRFNHDLRPTV